MSTPIESQRTRRELIQQYVRLQRELIEADPASSSYQATIGAFRRMGHLLIASGLEDDLDRLLRIRVLEGGQATRRGGRRDRVPDPLYVVEQRPAR